MCHIIHIIIKVYDYCRLKFAKFGPIPVTKRAFKQGGKYLYFRDLIVRNTLNLLDGHIALALML